MSLDTFKILVIDGGGAKGVYTIGILKELELELGSNLYNHFDLIYGTSTGAIIAALIAVGKPIDEIEKLYMEIIPRVMINNSSKGKSKVLKKEGDRIFGELTFDSFKTDIGIVSLNYDTQLPLIFKSNKNQAHGMKESFRPGFGCTISDAIQCSAAAYPIFEIKAISTSNQGDINAIDGGFIANNAILFALIDADKAFKIPIENIRLLSVGTGGFIEKPINWKTRVLSKFKKIEFIGRVLSASTNTNVIISKLLYPSLKMLRVNEFFTEPAYATNLIESDPKKLKKLLQLGRNTFSKHERDIKKLLKE